LKRKKKQIYRTFIDFEKAFDQMWRDCLWYKLLLNNINGKMFQIIPNMYKNIKSNIVYNNDKSQFFPCDNGVSQRVNMSSYLFAIFLNDLENFMENQNSTDLNTYRGH
jgi:hypothetical protein